MSQPAPYPPASGGYPPSAQPGWAPGPDQAQPSWAPGPDQAQHGQAQTAQPHPGQTQHAQAQYGQQPYPAQAYPAQAYPGQTQTGQPQHGQQAYPAQGYPAQAHPAQTQPGQAYPGGYGPAPAQANPAYGPMPGQPYPANGPAEIEDPRAAGVPGATCRLCGCAPAAKVTFRGHRGMILIMQFLSMKGPFCRNCGLATFRSMTSKSLVQGWWGYISFIVTPITVLYNLAVSGRVRRLAPPRPVPGAPHGTPLDPGPRLLARPMTIIGLGIPVALIILLFAVALSDG